MPSAEQRSTSTPPKSTSPSAPVVPLAQRCGRNFIRFVDPIDGDGRAAHRRAVAQMLDQHDAVRRKPLREDAEIRQLREAGERRRGILRIERRSKAVGERAVRPPSLRLQRHAHDALSVAARACERALGQLCHGRKHRERVGDCRASACGFNARVRRGVSVARQIRRVEVQRNRRAGRNARCARRRPGAGREIRGANRDASARCPSVCPKTSLTLAATVATYVRIGIERVGIDRDRVRLIGDAEERSSPRPARARSSPRPRPSRRRADC